jgi:diadenosine tetraphosphatase ApaH/serine/threonine PP2A family protein phosphatase
MLVVNSGSVGLPYDGDPRAAYVLIEDSRAIVRRVEYDVEEEVKALAESSLPHWDWVAKMLRSGTPQLP